MYCKALLKSTILRNKCLITVKRVANHNTDKIAKKKTGTIGLRNLMATMTKLNFAVKLLQVLVAEEFGIGEIESMALKRKW